MWVTLICLIAIVGFFCVWYLVLRTSPICSGGGAPTYADLYHIFGIARGRECSFLDCVFFLSLSLSLSLSVCLSFFLSLSLSISIYMSTFLSFFLLRMQALFTCKSVRSHAHLRYHTCIRIFLSQKDVSAQISRSIPLVSCLER